MLVIAVLFVYLYTGDVHTEAVAVADVATCQKVYTAARTEAEKDPKVRGATGGCISVPVPPVHDKV